MDPRMHLHSRPLHRAARWLRFAAVASSMLCCLPPAPCVADVPAREFVEEPAPARRSEAVPLTIGRNEAGNEHRLVIPAKLLDGLVKPKPGDKAATTPVRSIVAALALSAAIACGLVVGGPRRRSKMQSGLLVLCGIVSLSAAIVAVSGTAVADLLPPGGGPRRPRPVPLPEERDRRVDGGKIVVEVAEGGDEVVLLLGRDRLPTP